MKFNSLSLLSIIGSVVAAPAPTSSAAVTVTAVVDAGATPYDWSDGWVKGYSIHKSCNNTEFNQLTQAFEDTQELAAHARDHTLRFGNNSEFFRKYFGDDTPTGEVIGIFDYVINGDKSGVLFRCDDIDGNCKNDGWAGHWRGSNATDETVICDLSFTSRQFLSQVCSQGYTVAGSKNTVYWAGDLLHRIWHTDTIGQGVVGHYADTYEECLELAKTNASEAVRNSATLRYYALDVYAYDIAVPGLGCSGKVPSSSSEADPHATTSAAETKSSETAAETNSSETAAATSAAKEETSSKEESQPSPTATLSESHDHDSQGTECHTHANGETHCA